MVDRVHPHLPACEKAAIWWFVLCMYFYFNVKVVGIGGNADAILGSGRNSSVLRRHVRASGAVRMVGLMG